MRIMRSEKMNETKEDKPNKCNVIGCHNKSYGINRLTPTAFEWVCRRHYYDFNMGEPDYDYGHKK